jgi:hypothetical protein
MDYFTELLESYNKLKKRTFKLRFINENAQSLGGAEQLANAAIMNPTGQPLVDVNGNPLQITVEPNQEGGAKVIGLGGFSQGVTITDGTGAVTNPDAFNKLVNALGGQGAADEVDQQQVNQALELGVGQFLGDRATPETLASFKRQWDILEAYCEEIKKKYDRAGAGEQVEKQHSECIKRRANLFNDARSSFEAKLAAGQGYVFSEDGTPEVKELDAKLIEEVTLSHEVLMSYLDPGIKRNEDDCENVASLLGTAKGGNLVLYTSDGSKSEGVVIKPTSIQKRALENFFGICGISKSELSKVSFGAFTTNEKNAVKGTFFEDILATYVKMRSCVNTENPKACQLKSSQELALKIKEKERILNEIYAGIPIDGALDLDLAFEKEVIEEQLEFLNSGNLREHILREMSTVKQFLDFLDADDAIPYGQTAKSGAREDILLVYHDEAKAKQISNELGIKYEKTPEGTFAIGVGLKRLQKIHAAKFGEINSMSRMRLMINNDKSLVNDNKIDPLFLGRVQSKIYGGNTSRRQASLDYYNNLEDKIYEQRDLLTSERKVFNASKAKIDTLSPKTAINLVVDGVKSMSYLSGKQSLLSKALYMVLPGKEKELKNFKDDEANRERLAETFTRVSRMASCKKDIESGNQAAKDALLHQMFLCGYNSRDQAQLIVDDTGDWTSVNHNKVFNLLAENQKDITYDFKDSGVTLSLPNGLSVVYSFEGRNGRAGERGTRASVYLPKSTLNHPEIQVMSKKSNSAAPVEDAFTTFLKGQLVLLESLLNQTK